MKYIMAFGAHSDDIDIRAGGTAAKYVDKGYGLVYVVVTTSASGINGLSPNGSIKIRHGEARKAAKLYGTEPVFLDFHQCVYPPGKTDRLPKGNICISQASDNEKTIRMVTNLILKYKPEIILTHCTDDLHEDHYHTSALVYIAYKRIQKTLTSARLWLWPSGSRGSIIEFKPNKFVDIENYLAAKDRAIKEHKSQCARSPRLRTIAIKNAKFWGNKCRFRLAEAFIEVK
ncbi:MAG: PIG-L family deacetylase [Candidatus Aenigmarchaeota archaeon]|nr:PIG-L family deacetylase [Candidatus Aenigmarchaeota archaeon]